MSVPFSNTHLRVPRGFGAILEGLAREVLRDQPEDIPKYAARYFNVLLNQREASGVDPAEWAAKLQDRFYNNNAFRTTESSPKGETTTEVAISKEKSHDSQTEEESSLSAEVSNLSTTQPNVSEEADLSESTDKEEKHAVSEKLTISGETGLSEGESVNKLLVADIKSDEPSSTEEERDSTITTLDQVDRTANKTDSSSAPDQNTSQSESEATDLLLSSGISNLDVRAQELGASEDERGDEHRTAVVDKEIVNSEGEENIEVAQPVAIPPYSGLADVDVCATELVGTETAMERATIKDNIQLVEEPVESVLESSLSQAEILEGNLQEADIEAEKTKEEEGTETEASSGETHDSLAHIEDGLDDTKKDSLVEINFEDVPEAQQITEVGGKQSEECSIEVLQTEKLQMQQNEEFNEIIASATDTNISDTQDHDKPEIKGVEEEVNYDGEEMESQHETFDIMQEKVNTVVSSLNDYDDDDERETEVKNISSSDQPTTEVEKENQEHETDPEDEDNEKINEVTIHQYKESEKEAQSNDPDIKEDEMTDAVGLQKEEGSSEMEDQEMNNDGAENNSSQGTQSNKSMAAIESEILEESVQDPQEENEESQRTVAESQPEDTAEEKEVTSKKEEELTEGMTDSEAQEKSDAVHEEPNSSLTHGADWASADHQGEKRPLESEKDTT
ncbi:uro-adherence factor A-like [Embiotoca jacksoni]|uniref:uro-adherence factor A-like n=1 Tax=Embiotoca jacksoni TaxID=100190 RepID=UPI0037047EBF